MATLEIMRKPTKQRKPVPKTLSNAFTQALLAAFQPAAEAVTIATKDGYIIEANDAVERVYRWPKCKIIGQHPLRFCPEEPYWIKLSEKIWSRIQDDGEWAGAVMNWDQQHKQFPILLRVRKITFQRQTYVISWARTFPAQTPFGLSKQQAKIFGLLADGNNVPDIALQIRLTNRTVNTHLTRIWAKAGFAVKPSMDKLKALAVRVKEAGWDPEMKINTALFSSSAA